MSHEVLHHECLFSVGPESNGRVGALTPRPFLGGFMAELESPCRSASTPFVGSSQAAET